jgi:DNA-binding HxlR family transcriptional regulator
VPQTCGLADALAVIAGKWKPAIIWELHLAAQRFGALRRRLPGISEKVLFEQLRELEADGVLLRSIYEQGRVVCVEYQLTDAGAQLNAAVHALGEWGLAHAVGVLSGRAHGRVEPAAAARPPAHRLMIRLSSRGRHPGKRKRPP